VKVITYRALNIAVPLQCQKDNETQRKFNIKKKK